MKTNISAGNNELMECIETIIDYVIANHDISDVRRDYNEDLEILNAVQIALDTADSGDSMELDIIIE